MPTDRRRVRHNFTTWGNAPQVVKLCLTLFRAPVAAPLRCPFEMHNLLPCLALAALVTTPLTRTAEACGGSYESPRPAPPQISLVTTHTTGLATSRMPSRGRMSFAIIGIEPTQPEKLEWRRVSSSTSYDPTEVAPTGYYHRHTLTLLGASGTRVVSTKNQVALKNVRWNYDALFDALTLPVAANDNFTIALRGDHAGAVWHAFRPTFVQPSSIAGTNLSIKRGRGASFTILDGKREIGSHEGTVLGAVDLDGARYLVVTSGDGFATTIAVPFSA